MTWTPGLRNGDETAPGESTTKGHYINFADKYWSSPVSLSAGQRYHIVFQNIDGNGNNWISLNNPYAVRDNGRSSMAPSIADWGMTLDKGSGFAENTMREQLGGGTNRYDINLMVLMADGRHYGNSYMEAKSDYSVSGSSKLRQTFKPERTVNVSRLSVFVAGGGKLRATLIGNGSQVGSWVISTSGSGFSHYVTGVGNLTLQQGVQYHLEFSSDSGSLAMGTYRDGSLGTGKPYFGGGSWANGHSQISSGGGWSDTFFTYADVSGVAFS
jgi:hypothetical protein